MLDLTLAYEPSISKLLQIYLIMQSRKKLCLVRNRLAKFPPAHYVI
jgi:hypothetical protein